MSEAIRIETFPLAETVAPERKRKVTSPDSMAKVPGTIRLERSTAEFDADQMTRLSSTISAIGPLSCDLLFNRNSEDKVNVASTRIAAARRQCSVELRKARITP